MVSLRKTFEPAPAPVYQLLHPEEPHRRAALQAIEDAMGRWIGLPAFNHGVFRADEQGEQGLSAARTLPMMAERRLVVIRAVHLAGNAFFEALLAYLQSPTPSTVLVLYGEGFPKVKDGVRRWSTPVEKAVRAVGGWKMDRRARPDARRFVQEQAEAAGKRIEPSAVRVLLERVGEDLGRLEREVEKLALYVGDEPTITTGDVERLCALVSEAQIWDLTSAMVRRDRARSLAQLQRLLADGLDPRHLLATITWKIRGVICALEAMEAGANDADARKAGGLRFDEVKALRAAARRGVESPERTLLRLARAAHQMNASRAGDRRILERLVLDAVGA